MPFAFQLADGVLLNAKLVDVSVVRGTRKFIQRAGCAVPVEEVASTTKLGNWSAG